MKDIINCRFIIPFTIQLQNSKSQNIYYDRQENLYFGQLTQQYALGPAFMYYRKIRIKIATHRFPIVSASLIFNYSLFVGPRSFSTH